MIISISGLAGSGKDTIGNILIKKHNFTRIAFADALKSICSTITGLSWDMFNDPNLKDKELDNEVVFDEALAASLAFELNELGYNVIPSKFNSLLGAKLETPRKILVFIGTDVCRNHVEETIWRDVTLKKIKNTEGHVVITDARFKNERDAIRDLKGICMFVDRPSVSVKFDPFTAHQSELEQLTDSYDVYVINDVVPSILEYEVDMWVSTRLRML